ncbi:CUE domain-containing protein 2 isoform X3 [Lepeophtheirus salmonis]|uniref:CUE domain-containing protein 2 isoform X3 n=1 Tax=Lepeophtheirus salmonis TaxID=72036 RepID=UPI001AE5FB00|nr:CUE domain-containing protein 2-like isoform X2 [Lepeophtheirus salmonis]
MNDESISSSLLEFLRSQIPSIKVDDIDGILLDYVTSILEDLKEDSSNFDLDEFYEMLTAYIPDSASIESEILADWLIRTACEQRKEEPQGSSSSSSASYSFLSSSISKVASLDLSHIIKETPKEALEEEKSPDSSTSSTSSTSSDPTFESKENAHIEESCEDERYEFQDKMDSLSELFPYACQLEVVHCLSLAEGDIDNAAHLIMIRNETGQSFRAPTDRKIIKANTKPILNAKELKEKIVGKYGFIDQAEDSRYHRPNIKKTEDKKLIRYRDGKIVSTKGERFTQVKKEGPEEMKKSNFFLELRIRRPFDIGVFVDQ